MSHFTVFLWFVALSALSCASPYSKVALTSDNAPVVDGIKLGFTGTDGVSVAMKERCARMARLDKSVNEQKCSSQAVAGFHRLINRQRVLNFYPPVHQLLGWKERPENPELAHKACVDQNQKVDSFRKEAKGLRDQLAEGEAAEKDRFNKFNAKRAKEEADMKADPDDKYEQEARAGWKEIFADRDKKKKLWEDAVQRYNSVDVKAMKPAALKRHEALRDENLAKMKGSYDKVQKRVDEFEKNLKEALARREQNRKDQRQVWSREDSDSQKVADTWSDLKKQTLKEVDRLESEPDCQIASYLFYEGIFVREGKIVAYLLSPFAGKFDEQKSELEKTSGDLRSVKTFKEIPLEFEGRIEKEVKVAHFSKDPMQAFLIARRLPDKALAPGQKSTKSKVEVIPEYGDLQVFYVLSGELDLFERSGKVIDRVLKK